jgi:hypothetical protein
MVRFAWNACHGGVPDFSVVDPSAQCPLGETFSRDPEPCQPVIICSSDVSEGSTTEKSGQGDTKHHGRSPNPADSPKYIPPQIFPAMLRMSRKMASFISESCGFSEIYSASDLSGHASHVQKDGVI